MTRPGRRSRTGTTGSGRVTSSDPEVEQRVGTEGTMMMQAAQQRRFHLSLRSLMIFVAACALLLVPVIWVAQQTALLRAEHMRASDAERRARAGAARAQYVAQFRSAQAQLVPKAADP